MCRARGHQSSVPCNGAFAALRILSQPCQVLLPTLANPVGEHALAVLVGFADFRFLFADRIGSTEESLSLLRPGVIKGTRLETLARICEVLECQQWDILEAVESGRKKALDTVAQTP